MRNQRRTPLTVQLIQVTSTKDPLGNATETTSTTTVEGATFDPERTIERTGEDQVPIVQPAVFNLPGVYEINADDLVIHADTTWQVVGGGAVWLDRTKVPVVQPRGV